jgi:hypothetical protein
MNILQRLVASLLTILICGTTAVVAPGAPADPLPSWNNTASKRAIVEFVDRVTHEGSPAVVPVAERIAVFDNDGTLWPENPVPFQAAFVRYEIRRQLPQHPEWNDDPAVKGILTGDVSALTSDDNKGLLRVLTVTHAGMTVEEFGRRVRA